MKLDINGKVQDVAVPAEMPLLWALRDVVGLRGTKFGCGMGLCGSCTVLLDGTAIRACVTPVSAIGKGKVTTIEGLHPEGNHPVQQAWRQHDVPQCGYCQSGQIMQACSLLRDKPQPSDKDIDAGMAGNICRCGTYPRIRQAIHTAAAATPAKAKPAAKQVKP